MTTQPTHGAAAGTHAHAGGGRVHRAGAAPDLAQRLRERGLRMTPQREQVLAAVRELGHATPERISEAVDGVDVTTVYRTLELLEELGLVRHTHLDHRAPAYRPAEDDHIHIVCHSCASVIEAPADVAGIVAQLEHRLLDERGFALDRSHFTVFGRCADCGPADGEAPGTAETGGGHRHGAQRTHGTEQIHEQRR